MALTMTQKNDLVNSGKVKQYAGKSRDEIEKLLGQQNTTSPTPNYTALSSITQNNAAPQSTGYQSPYSSDIANALKSITNMGSFSYDPSEDEGLKAAQDEAIAGVSRGAARRNMLYSDSNKSQMGKSALALIPQFEQNAFNKYQSQLGNLFNQLSTLTNLENQNYGRYRDTVNDANQQEQQQFQNNVALAGITGYYNPYGGTQINPEVNQYSGDFQAEINRRQATPDTADDALISSLQSARANKVFSDPALLQKYGDQYKTADTRQREANQAAQDKSFEESIRQFNTQQGNWQKQFTFNEMQHKIENALAQKRISQDGAQIALAQARFAADQDPNSLDNQYKRMQIQNMQQDNNTQLKQLATKSALDYLQGQRDEYGEAKPYTQADFNQMVEYFTKLYGATLTNNNSAPKAETGDLSEFINP